MKNIIYNIFLEQYAEYNIDILKDKTFKIALVDSNYVADEKSDSNFYTMIQNPGFEIEDANGNYEKGGQYVKFKALDGSSTDGMMQYSVGKVLWTDVNMSDVCQAVVYRVTDGLLVACYRFNYPISPKDKDLLLDWDSIAMITIQSSKTEIIEATDDRLSTRSTQPIQNKAVTDTFGTLGVIFTDDGKPLPDVDEAESFEGVWANKLTYVTMLKDEDIDTIFDEAMEDA